MIPLIIHPKLVPTARLLIQFIDLGTRKMTSWLVSRPTSPTINYSLSRILFITWPLQTSTVSMEGQESMTNFFSSIHRNISSDLMSKSSLNIFDPQTTWVWTVWIHLYVDFLSNYIRFGDLWQFEKTCRWTTQTRNIKIIKKI